MISIKFFHEIRMNWKQPLYLECIFPNPWEKPLYLAVLEDNPFERWNDHVDEEVQKNVTEYLDKEAMQLKLRNYTAKSILLWKMGIGMLFGIIG